MEGLTKWLAGSVEGLAKWLGWVGGSVDKVVSWSVEELTIVFGVEECC